MTAADETGMVWCGTTSVWWVVITPGHRILVRAHPDRDPDAVTAQALRAMGHTPVLQALGEDGEWFTPSGPVGLGAMTRHEFPAHLTDRATARHATVDDINLHEQTFPPTEATA